MPKRICDDLTRTIPDFAPRLPPHLDEIQNYPFGTAERNGDGPRIARQAFFPPRGRHELKSLLDIFQIYLHYNVVMDLWLKLDQGVCYSGLIG
jgi:hypothetical protein